MKNFNIQKTNIDGLLVIRHRKNSDARGSFEKIISNAEFKELGIEFNLKQVNVSFTKDIGTLRGMHYSSSLTPEDKLVTCITGSVFDVILDLRSGSKSYLDVFSLTLSHNDVVSILIPGGCAHGFQVLKKNSTILYLHTREYEPETEAGVHFADPGFSIPWPLPIAKVSDRDANLKNWGNS